ncbi:dTDP-4-amino-4,6-dideoxygalactose transaminase [Gemmatimonadota bacterium]
MNQIRFNAPTATGREYDYLAQAHASGRLSGDGEFSTRAVEELSRLTGQSRVLLTGSCSHALDMAAMLLNLRLGDEVIMPSYTFASTANAFVLQGAVPVFVDIRPDTMNIDETLIESAISEHTKAIVVMHYGGVACAMDEIIKIAVQYGLALVEDAAQAINAHYNGQHLGTIGTFGTFSFHDTKNITSGGEGGALLVNDIQYYERARIIREKGTNRAQFFEGQVDKYTWVDIGSSFLMAEINAAYLLPQLEDINRITAERVRAWQRYKNALAPLIRDGILETAVIPKSAMHNGHLFYVKTRDSMTRGALISWLKDRQITAPFHYIPLHTAPAGKRFGRFCGIDKCTSTDAARIMRLPLFSGISDNEIDKVIQEIYAFFSECYA